MLSFFLLFFKSCEGDLNLLTDYLLSGLLCGHCLTIKTGQAVSKPQALGHQGSETLFEQKENSVLTGRQTERENKISSGKEDQAGQAPL